MLGGGRDSDGGALVSCGDSDACLLPRGDGTIVCVLVKGLSGETRPLTFCDNAEFVENVPEIGPLCRWFWFEEKGLDTRG